MFASTQRGDEGPTPSDTDAAAVRAMVQRLATATGPTGTGAEIDAERIELIRSLEELKNTAAGLQALTTEAFDTSQCEQQVAAGTAPSRAGRGVAEQIALARRVSPHQGRRHLSLARVLRSELPATCAALRAGKITERAATLVAHGTACVSREDRAAIDHEISANPERASRLGEAGVRIETAKAAYRLDPASVVERRRSAEAERYVSLRPAPDTMTYLTALLPVADGVAVYAALTQAADAGRASGAPRTRGQLMADTLRDAVLAQRPPARHVAGSSGAPTTDDESGSHNKPSVHSEPTTDDESGGHNKPSLHSEPSTHSGRTDPRDNPDETDKAGALTGAPAGTGVVLNLIMSEQQLFGTDSTSEGEVLIGGVTGGLTHIDADLARQVAALTSADRLWLRRLYRRPETGELVAMDSRQRRFPRGLQRLIRFRDQRCRTPWCGAPIRHTDHARRAADQGASDRTNGQGTCEACNYGKEAFGWSARAETDPAGRHRVITTTPTGHTYTTTPPAPPGSDDTTRAISVLWTTRSAPRVEIVREPPTRAA